MSDWDVDTRAIQPVPEAERGAVADALRALLTVVTMFDEIGQLEDGVIEVYRHEQMWLLYRVWVDPRVIEVFSRQMAP